MTYFPDSLVIELHADMGGYSATSKHVTNIPVQLHSPPPMVVQTFGRGDTPSEALDELLANIVAREAT